MYKDYLTYLDIQHSGSVKHKKMRKEFAQVFKDRWCAALELVPLAIDDDDDSVGAGFNFDTPAGTEKKKSRRTLSPYTSIPWNSITV
jgi:hypothetical protein